MSNTTVYAGSRKISELVACTSPTSNDSFVLVANSSSNTEKSTIDTVLNSGANVTGNIVTGSVLITTNNTTPTTNTDTVTQGTIWHDGLYLYIAVADDDIRRITLETFS